MSSLWIRNKIIDKVLTPLRRQITEFIPSDCNVVDIGCANGRLLLEVADRINSGVGVDLNKRMISFAVKKLKKYDFKNLQFVAKDAVEAIEDVCSNPTMTICSLCLHEMVYTKAIEVMNQYSSISEKLIIADLCEPESWLLKKLLHFDEWTSRHYNRFVSYLNNGGMPGLIDMSQIDVIEEHETKISSIRIWVCDNYYITSKASQLPIALG